MNILKRLFKFFMIFLVVLFIIISIFFLTFDLNTYRGVITSKASEALGRQVSIDSMAMKLSLIPTVEVKGITIANDASFKDETQPLLKIDSLDATLALIPLLKGQIEISAFNMATADVLLIERDGKNNYTFGKTEKTPVQKQSEKTGAQPNNNILERLSVDTIKIKKLSVLYLQEAQKHALSLTNVSVEQLKLIKMTVQYNGKIANIEANLGNLAGLIAKKPNYSFSAKVDAFGAKANLSGTIGDTANFSNILLNLVIKGSNLKNTVGYFAKVTQLPATSFDVDLTIKGGLNSDIKVDPLSVVLGGDKALVNTVLTLKNPQTTKQLLAAGTIDIRDEALATQYGIKPIVLTFDVGADEKTIVLNKLTASAGKSDIIMNGGVSLAEAVPLIKTQIVSQYFDLNDFVVEQINTTPQEKTQKTQENKPLFSEEKIDLSVLKKVNASAAVTAQYVKLPQVDNIGVSVTADLKDGYLKVPTFAIRTTAGTLSGSAGVNASQTPLTASFKMTSDELSLDTIKAVSEELRGSEVVTSVDLTTKGDSVKSFMSALNGQIVVEVTKGEILNKWFNSLPVAMGVFKNRANAVTFSTSDQISSLTCGAINLTVKNGVITSDNQIAIETSVVNFSVSGEINLPKEELSLTMIPSVVGAKDKVQEALTLTQIVKISGPFSNLKPSLDTKKTAETVVKGGLTVLANKLAEKQGGTVSSSSSAQSYNLCERVLGRPLTGQERAQSAVAQKVSKTETHAQENTKMDAKDMFKQQLLNSLTEALKK